jgi:hypothetical protein
VEAAGTAVLSHRAPSLILNLKKRCPECKREQIGPSSQRKKTADQQGHDAIVFAVFSGIENG